MPKYLSKYEIISELIIQEDSKRCFLDKYFEIVQSNFELNSLVYYIYNNGIFILEKSYGINQPFAESIKEDEVVDLFVDSNVIKLKDISPLNRFFNLHLALAILIKNDRNLFGLVLIGKNYKERTEINHSQNIIEWLEDIGSIIGDYDRIRESIINSYKNVCSNVLRSLTHDIRNPIQMVTILSEMLKAKELPLEKRLNLYNKLSGGLNQIDKLATVVSDLFKNSMEINIDEIPCNIFFNEVKSEIQSSLQKLKIQFELNINCNINLQIDIEKMKDAILRILKYSRDLIQFDGLISLNIEANNEMVQISIIDTSDGIDEKVLRNLKNPFFNYGARLGTGLNFAIIHHIIEAHKGTLDISNEKEGGAKFLIRIPIKQLKN
ncbi:MAG TPA: HAMP domain-containing sensor histidine kinase [Ignavibacteria bacterium]